MPFAFGSNPRGVQATTQAPFASGAVLHRYLVSHLRQPCIGLPKPGYCDRIE